MHVPEQWNRIVVGSIILAWAITMCLWPEARSRYWGITKALMALAGISTIVYWGFVWDGPPISTSGWRLFALWEACILIADTVFFVNYFRGPMRKHERR
jgi:hypothetical protein